MIKRIALVGLVVVVAFIFQGCSRNPYENIGLNLKELPTASSSLNVVRFSYKTTEQDVVGPDIGGTDLYFEFEDMPDGVRKRITARSRIHKTYETVVVFNPKAVGKGVFVIERTQGLGVAFPEQGYFWP